MRTSSIVRWSSMLIVLAMLLTACGAAAPATGGATAAPAAGGAATAAPAAGAEATAAPAAPAPTAAPAAGGDTAGNFQIPAVEDGKFNVAMILIGPHDDGG